MSTRLMILAWILLGGAFLAASKAATGSTMRGLWLLAAVVCFVMMFVTAY